MSSDNPYQGQPGPYGQGGQGGQPPGTYDYPPPNTPPGQGGYAFGPFAPQQPPGGAGGVPPGIDPAPGPAPGGPVPGGPPPGPLPGPGRRLNPTGPSRDGAGA